MSLIFNKFINNKFKLLAKNEFFKNILTLATGAGFSQILPLLIIPILSRLYEPNDYALLAVYSSITVLIGSVCTGMYTSAIILDKIDEDAVNTAGGAALILVIVTLLSITFILLFHTQLTRLIDNVNINFWLYIVPFTVFFQGFYQILYSWNNRKARFKRLAMNRIIMTTVSSSLTLGLGYLGFKEKGLLLSLISGQIISSLLVFIQTLKNDSKEFSQVSKQGVINSLKRHIDFPKYSMPQAFIDGFRESSLVWVFSNFFGSTALGSFSFARSVVFAPLQLIGGAVGEVFYQKASDIYNSKGDLYFFAKKTFILLVLIGLPFTLAILFFGDYLFSLLFSSKWQQSGVFSQILVLWLYIRFASSPLSTIPLILKKQKTFFYFGILVNFLPIVVLYFLGLQNIGVNSSLIVFTTISTFAISSFVTWVLLLVKNKSTSIF